MRGRTIWLLGLLVLLVPLLAACRGREAATEVGILGYNHTDGDIPQFTINGGNGGSARRHAEGGTVCCTLMPDQWKPGMDVQVRWTNDLTTYHQATVSRAPLREHRQSGGALSPQWRGKSICHVHGPWPSGIPLEWIGGWSA